MPRTYNDACSNRVTDKLRSLDIYFVIIIIFLALFSGLFIAGLVMDGIFGKRWNLLGNAIPSYAGIAFIILLIVAIFAVITAAQLRREVCPNDGIRYSLLG